MLFLFALSVGCLAFPVAGLKDILPSLLRSSDAKVVHYSDKAEKYVKLANDAIDKEVKMLNEGKEFKASGKLILHSLKNPKTRAALHAKGLLDTATLDTNTASKAREHLERLKVGVIETLYKFRSSDDRVKHYSKKAQKFFDLQLAAPSKDLKRYYGGKHFEASGEQILHSLKNQKARNEMKAAGLL